eukprot:10679413-Ditylum_brightwellii.AAC.1
MAVSFHELSLLTASTPCASKTTNCKILSPMPWSLSVMAVLCAGQEKHSGEAAKEENSGGSKNDGNEFYSSVADAEQEPMLV